MAEAVRIPAVALAPHYYRDNFERLLDTVEDQYGDLLAAGEHRLAERWRGLSLPAQCLYVRLVSRRGPWFREAFLDYPEIGDCSPRLDELVAAGLAGQARQLTVEEIGQLCTRDELVRGFSLPPARKPQMLAALAARGDTPCALSSTLAALDGARIIAPLGTDIVALYQLLFFGNRRQGLTDFVLSELGVARYFPYAMDRSRRFFPHRDAVDEYLRFAALEDRWREIQEDPLEDLVSGVVDLAGELLQTQAGHPASQQRRDRLCNRLARELERADELDLALRLYRQSTSHPARERAARVLERQGEDCAALRIAEAALDEPWCEEERDAMSRIATRLCRRLGQARPARQRDDFSIIELVLPAGEPGVERLAAAHLEAHWPSVRYVENALMNSLFGLAFWEEIFAPVAGAFTNPFQAAPVDMYQRSFSQRRRALLEARFAVLADCDLRGELLRAFHAYRSYQCRWTDWRVVDEALIAAAAGAIPAAHLMAIWRRMLFDPRENRSGFPDLVALGNSPGEYCLIEVKGPGDKLQESQKRWLRFFSVEGIPARVAQVTWADD